MEPSIPAMPTPAIPPVSYAGFWKRFFAHLIDNLVIAVFAMVVLVPFLAMAGIGFATYEEGDIAPEFLAAIIGAYLTLILGIVVGGWLYYALMESKNGATLGKIALNIRVTDLNGQPISFSRASGRYFGKIVSGLTLNIGYIIAAFTEKKQALHDLMAGCLVVNNN
jgi:uncharacterized RDD family membrane protein YckC